MALGELYVITFGEIKTLVSLVANLDTQTMVKINNYNEMCIICTYCTSVCCHCFSSVA